MDEKRILGSMETGGFGTSVNFDIDAAPVPKRRRKNQFWQRAGDEVAAKIGGLGIHPEEFGERTRELFDEFDTDSSGAIDISEFAAALDGLGLDFPNEQIEQMYGSVEHDNNGEIDFTHFEELVLLFLEKSALPQESEIGCPGCGAEITNEEWLEALVGFVSGAHAHSNESPVKARIVQNLRNEVLRMRIPNQSNEWELEVVDRLTNQITNLIQAEVSRYRMDNENPDVDMIRQQALQQAREELTPVLEEQIFQQAEAKLAPLIEVQIRQQLEAELAQILDQERKQMETEMWQKFEQEWRQRSSE